MGGTALNIHGVTTERKNTDDFMRIARFLMERIANDLKLNTTIVKCYHTKQDHGDLDLLVRISQPNFDYINYIQNTFNPQAIHTNANVHSFDYENFQIDFIKIPHNSWNTANTYYSYDPLGNIMGKAYHRFGLSYGWDGLWYKFRGFGGSNSHDILVSTDPEKIFALGDYDYEKYLQGFETLEDIYQFCIASKYFNSETFKMENLTQIDRKRNRKRKSYAAFLQYIEDQNITKSYAFNTKESYLQMVNDYFPESNLIVELNKLKVEDELNRKAHEKFNGAIIMEWIPGLQGKELGQAITNFKDYLISECVDYRTYVLTYDIEMIKTVFINLYNKMIFPINKI